MKTATAAKTALAKMIFQDTPPAAVAWGLHPSPAGPLMIGITPMGAICRLSFATGSKPAAILKEWQEEWPETVFTKAERETGHVAKEITKTFKKSGQLPAMLLIGTPFQHKVWKGLMTIPAGKTVSYATLAQRIKNPKAARAVGNACGKNPVPLLVPCHRVIANDGGLGGFTSGLGMKRMLLEAEGTAKPKKNSMAR